MNSQSRGPGVADMLFSAAKNNPEGLLLLAAGVALLARTSSRSGGGGQRSGYATDGGHGSAAWQPGQQMAQGMSQGMSRGMSQGMEAARQSMADMGGRVSDAVSSYTDQASRTVSSYADQASRTVSSYADQASRYANDASRRIAEQSGQFYESATSTLQDTVQRVVREQPLMVALAGVAAGAAVAAAFPRTDIEERTLGPAGERITDFAAEKAEQVKNAGLAAGQQLASSAEQRGLSADGLKELAREAADAFGRSLSDKGSGSGSGPGGGSGGGGGGGGGSQPRIGGKEDMDRLE